MTTTKRSNFCLGFWLGAAVCALIWYWQKSTSADEGALHLLDELAEIQAKFRNVAQARTMPLVTPVPDTPLSDAVPPDDLTLIHGIGPVYAQRLKDAGIHTFADLAAQAPDKLAEIVELREWQAASPVEWIAEAQALAAGAQMG